MSSDDIKIILRKFYMRLRNTVQPQDIAPIIDGLTDFDRQQIAATAKNEGSMLGNDKLLDTLGRRTTRSFISFITHLSESNSELAEEIKEYTFKYFQHIHNSFQNYQREQTRPFATVKPSVTSHSSSETQSHSRSALSHLPGAVPQVTFNREQESTFTTTTFTHFLQSVHRTTELRPPTFTEDTLLEDVPNIVFLKWATELNHRDSWNKLGDILQLTRKQIKELKNKSNPGEEILDLLSSKEEVTVKGLVDLLHSVQLSRVVDIIKQSLEPTVHDEFTNRSEFTDRRETHTSRTENTSSTPNQQSFRNEQNRDEANPPMEEVKKSNLNDSTESSTNNEDAGETTGAEGVNKTLINNLNRSEYKFEMVKEVHIYLPGDGDKTQVVKDSNISKESVERENSSDKGTSTVEQEVSSEENMTPSPGVGTQTNHMSMGNHQVNESPTQLLEQTAVNQMESLLMGNQNVEQTQLLEPSAGATAVTSMEVDQQPSHPVSESLVGGQLIAQLSSTGNEKYAKNLEQERNELSFELRNQPNLDSFRDLRNSIPDSDQSPDNTALKQHGNERRHFSDLTHQPESTLGHYEKNVEQEYQALHRDVTNQHMFDSTGDVQ